ncbi:glutamate racemase [Sphingomonas jatrophae]|uniref:Glutamate racemase n=1 Tax=Sphingomonas jatrophae TaxID=1166337 RepID=A0A1I6JZC9_9SPHN|nr:glutamate racemase [Sphingomonas jatrophae]SFR84313.1 glutamate racemase [Sphingomonas jatrophae]
MDADRPLLFFDSGVGGLSVLGPTRALLPRAPVVYVADNGGYPYGTKSEAEIAARVPALLGRLAERHAPRLVVIACNTASTIALDGVRAALDLPVVGTVPAIKPAALASRSRVIGVLGTEATVRQPYVDRLSARHAADCTVIRHGSAALVRLAEAKLAGEPVSAAEVAAAVAPMIDHPEAAALDTVVLACTHFPLLADELAAAFGPQVGFVDGGAGIARRVAFLTEGQPWPETPAPGIALFTQSFLPPAGLAASLARFGLEQIATL